MATLEENLYINNILKKEIIQYWEDFYAGKIPIECDDDCPEDCDGNHGFYKPDVEFTPLFTKE